MEESTLIKEVDIHLLELRYGHIRVQNIRSLVRMQNSINCHGQIVPVLAVTSEDGSRFVLIDGYLRLKALVACGRDCINLQVMDGNEQDALVTLLARNNNRQWEVIEEAAMLHELHIRFSCSYGAIAQKIGKDKSWVKRRVDLLCELPEEITQAVMSGKLSTWAASRVLAPLARANAEDASQLTKKLIKDPLSTRDLSLLYGHYKKSNRVVRDRIIADPALFIKAAQQQDQERGAKEINDGPEGKWLKDITIVCHMLKRLTKTAKYAFYPDQGPFKCRQMRIWVKKADQYLVELKEMARREEHDQPIEKAVHSGDGGQECGLA
jgi:ParB family chromosome partitioning protein